MARLLLSAVELSEYFVSELSFAPSLTYTVYTINMTLMSGWDIA